MRPALDINAFMESWTLQMGYPVVHVSKEGGEITISQEKYKFGNLTDPPSPLGYVSNHPSKGTSASFLPVLNRMEVICRQTFDFPILGTSG